MRLAKVSGEVVVRLEMELKSVANLRMFIQKNVMSIDFSSIKVYMIVDSWHNDTLLHMKRDLYIEKIEKWNCSPRRKPLILEGARQVGKTWLMQEFAKTHYENVVYARFDKNRTLRSVFDQDFDIDTQGIFCGNGRHV